MASDGTEPRSAYPSADVERAARRGESYRGFNRRQGQFDDKRAEGAGAPNRGCRASSTATAASEFEGKPFVRERRTGEERRQGTARDRRSRRPAPADSQRVRETAQTS